MLDEFRPELIINSAGQDNHYSDPITHMNFCAQGYAKLSGLIKQTPGSTILSVSRMGRPIFTRSKGNEGSCLS